MRAIITPSEISGNIVVPASKSAMQRACAAALIKGGKTVLHNPGISADDQAALNIIQQLGARVELINETLSIESNGVQSISEQINCGESGLSVRMFTSIAAVSGKKIQINGSGSLLKRPLSFFDEVLPQLDVYCKSNQGLLPLQICGPLHPKNIEVDGFLSSQFLTGLLFAYAAANPTNVSITVNNLNSKPYIDLTLEVMRSFGLKTPVNHDYKEFYFDDHVAHISTNQPFHYTIESDWSSASFLLVAAAIAGKLTVTGLDLYSTQADKAIITVLKQTGVLMGISEKQIEIEKTILNPFQFDARDCPDLFPPLVALAAYCNGTSVIEGVRRLLYKESNRALSLQAEFRKLGVEIRVEDDLMIIEGGKELTGNYLSAHHDHRIAMACAVAGLRANGTVTIEGAEAVDKSYPQFWNDLQKLNAEVSLINN